MPEPEKPEKPEKLFHLFAVPAWLFILFDVLHFLEDIDFLREKTPRFIALVQHYTPAHIDVALVTISVAWIFSLLFIAPKLARRIGPTKTVWLLMGLLTVAGLIIGIHRGYAESHDGPGEVQWYSDQIRTLAHMADWIAVIIGVIAIGFAVYEHIKRAKLETVILGAFQRSAGEIRVISINANWADSHLRTIGHLFAEPNPNLTEIRKQASDAARDAAACARKLSSLHSHIKGIQKSLFKDEDEKLPDIDADDVRLARSKWEASKTAPLISKPEAQNPK